MGQPSLHGRRPCLASELQRSVRPDKVVVAANHFEVVLQLFRAPGVARCASRQISGSLPDGEIQPFDERGVERR